MQTRTIVLIVMIVLAALSRLAPHPENFAPITAIALFGAAHFDRRWLAFAVPMMAMFIADVGLEFLYRFGFSESRGLHPLLPVVYGTFLVIAALGLLLRGKNTLPRVAGTVLASSLIFFLVTNFAVWVWTADAPFPDGYPKTWAGLMECYANGLFGRTLLGDAVYSTVLFGAFALAAYRWPALRPSAVQPACA